MDHRVKDILNRIEKNRPTDPGSMAKTLCGSDVSLLAEVLHALGADQGTMEVSVHSPPPTPETPIPKVANPDKATVEAPQSDDSRNVASGSSKGSERIPRTGERTKTRLRRPDRIGHFQIESEIPIGRGGFGEVWEAFRVEGGFRQRVAIKIISRAVPDEKIIRRFELERQVLASLDHPDIARLIDGGEMDDGRPWLAMEYVDGVAVTTYCDRERLSIDERVKIFMKIAIAVQHAHENLVVHRDIKPDNVLVTAKGDPKLLDFGIAKLVNPDLGGEAGRVTQAGEGVLTPDYAAPEQFTGETIGTRADVYSLGVLLYELLTSRLPFHDEERGYINIRTAKLEKEPGRPSDAVSTASIDPETARKISASRDTGLDRIRRRLDGDLDVIILKALRREPSRRYASPRDLVADLQRHIDGLPVEARPDSIGYRTTRFVARHRAGVAVSSTVVVAIALAAITFAAVAEARSSRTEAALASSRAETETARAENSETIRAALAGIELQAAARGTESMVSSLSEANRLDDAARLADAMLERIDTALEIAPTDPDLIARRIGLELQLAKLQWQRRNPSLGDREDGARRRADVEVSLNKALLDHPGHPDLLFIAALLELLEADALPAASRRPRLEAALSRLSQAETASNRRFPRQRSMIGTDLGDVLKREGDLEGALDAYARSHAAHLNRDGDTERDLAMVETRMAAVLTLLGQNEDAQILHERSLERRRGLADQAAPTESARARRDLANGHWYLADALAASSPATARRHLKRYLDLTFEVAWLDPLDRRGAVTDLMTAMSRASRLISLHAGDTGPFADAITRYRDSIVKPRLEALPDADARKLAIRADRYLSEVDLALAGAASSNGDLKLAETHREAIRGRLDRTLDICRALLSIEAEDPELIAEIGLCIMYRAAAEQEDREQVSAWIREANDLRSLARERPGDGPLRRKLDRQLEEPEV